MKRWFVRLLPARAIDVLRSISRHWSSGLTSNYRAISSLSVYVPNSTNFWTHPATTFSSANSLPEKLLELTDQLSPHAPEAPSQDGDWFQARAGAGADRLRELFDEQGSDKGTLHGYYPTYASIIEPWRHDASRSLLEIGIGTTDPKALSTMGRSGVAGASLRAFRDFTTGVRIFGADVDRRTLFAEERIVTAWVDQLVPASFDQMVADLRCEQFDLIIDDGLHSIEANLNSLIFAVSKLRPGGWVVIEDVPAPTLTIWRLVGRLLRESGWQCRPIACRNGHLIVMRNRIGSAD